jgi:hypothetical protein
MADDDAELVRNDPESERLAVDLTALIAEELFASIAVRRPLDTTRDADVVAGLIADAVLDRYVVRERPENEPRDSWRRHHDEQR